MFGKLTTIARNTFVESIRQPIFLVLVLTGCLALILGTAWSAYTMDDDNVMQMETGLSMIFVTGLLLAAFTATGVVSSEIENRTVLTVVSKPVPRPLFIVGKYLGVAAALAVGHVILCAVFLLSLRHQVMQTASDQFDGPVIVFGVVGGLLALAASAWANYFYRWPFNSTAVGTLAGTLVVGWGLVLLLSKQWGFQSPATDFSGQMMLGLLLVLQAVLIIAAAAIAASTRLKQVMTLVACAALFLLGVVSDSVFGRFVHDQSPLTAEGWLSFAGRSAGAAAYYLIPNLQFLAPADALILGNPFSAAYILAVSGYAALYIVALLAVAVALFQTREVG